MNQWLMWFAAFKDAHFFFTWCLSDAAVCVFNTSCILPCSFKPGADVVIHWIHVNGKEITIHSYYHGRDQLAYQDQRFKARTSLFLDQISKGDAALQLSRVEVQDQGRYKCYTSTIAGNHESFININVEGRKFNHHVFINLRTLQHLQHPTMLRGFRVIMCSRLGPTRPELSSKLVPR